MLCLLQTAETEKQKVETELASLKQSATSQETSLKAQVRSLDIFYAD